MRELRHKVRNGQNLPHESPNFTNHFFQSHFTPRTHNTRKTDISHITGFCESCDVCEQYEFCGQATHEQPSCVMSDRRLNPEQNVTGFSLIPYNLCTS